MESDWDRVGGADGSTPQHMLSVCVCGGGVTRPRWSSDRQGPILDGSKPKGLDM